MKEEAKPDGDITQDFIQFLEKVKSSNEIKMSERIANLQKKQDSETDPSRKDVLVQLISLYKQAQNLEREINEKQQQNLAIASRIAELEKSLFTKA